MDGVQAIAILAAGFAAGTINTIVGSGSLVSFPTLLAFGYAPLVANVSNTVGIVGGSLSGVVGYRKELAGQARRALPLVIAALGGGLTGALLLLVLPARAFTLVVPFLILGASLLVAAQPRISRAVSARRAARPHALGDNRVLAVLVYLTGIYGGYFGAGQGVILIALLAILLDDDLQRLNALKNLLAAVVNGVAAVVFIVVAPIAWPVVILLAVGSIAGGQFGAIVGRRLSPLALRAVIVIVGIAVSIRLFLG